MTDKENKEQKQLNDNKTNKFGCVVKKYIVYVFLFIIIGIILLVGVPIIINESYRHIGGYPTVWGGEDVLSFYGSFLAFVGTVSLGALALWQNKQANDINKNIMGIEKKREKDKLYSNIKNFVENTEEDLLLHKLLDDFERFTYMQHFSVLKTVILGSYKIKRDVFVRKYCNMRLQNINIKTDDYSKFVCDEYDNIIKICNKSDNAQQLYDELFKNVDSNRIVNKSNEFLVLIKKGNLWTKIY